MTDEDFVADIFDASYRRLVGQLFVMCGDLGTAEDLVQEAFVRALDHSHSFRHLDNPEAWLTRVAVNLARSRWRRLKTYAGLQPRLAERPEPFEPADHVDLVAALGELAPGQRDVVVLYHLADLPVPAVAALLGIPAGTVKSRLARARSALAERLGEPEEDRHV